MGISTEFYSNKNDINFIDVNAKSLWPFSTFVNQVLKFYPHFACSERLRKFPIKYGDLYICGRGMRKLPVQYWHRNHCCIWSMSLVAKRLQCLCNRGCNAQTGRRYIAKPTANDRHTLRNHFATDRRPVADEAPIDHRLIADHSQICHYKFAKSSHAFLVENDRRTVGNQPVMKLAANRDIHVINKTSERQNQGQSFVHSQNIACDWFSTVTDWWRCSDVLSTSIKPFKDLWDLFVIVASRSHRCCIA